MSTLKTNNIEHLDASTPSIQTTIGGGTILAGVSTVSGTLSVGTGTSISSPATNELALGTNDVERLRITSDGKVGIGTDNPGYKLHIGDGTSQANLRLQSGNSDISLLSMIGGTSQTCRIEFGDSGDDDIGKIYYDNSDNSMQFATNTSESFRVDSSQRILKGWESTAFSGTGQSSDIAIAGTSSNNGLQVIRYNTSFGAYGLTIGRSKNGTIGTHGQVVSGNDIGFVSFVASDGTNWRGCADIAANADGNITSSSAEGKLIFKTTKSGSTTPTQAMTIKANHNVEIHDGNLVFETSGNGIDFSATADGSGTSNTSELLDDYETGNWTPVLKSSTNVITVTGTQNYYRYIKVGRLVTVFYCINNATTSGTTGGGCTVAGLPFAPSASTANNRFVSGDVMFYNTGFKLDAWPVSAHTATGDLFVNFYEKGSSGAPYGSANVNTVGSGSYFFFTLSYYTD